MLMFLFLHTSTALSWRCQPQRSTAFCDHDVVPSHNGICSPCPLVTYSSDMKLQAGLFNNEPHGGTRCFIRKWNNSGSQRCITRMFYLKTLAWLFREARGALFHLLSQSQPRRAPSVHVLEHHRRLRPGWDSKTTHSTHSVARWKHSEEKGFPCKNAARMKLLREQIVS